jgi:hypothetical protein
VADIRLRLPPAKRREPATLKDIKSDAAHNHGRWLWLTAFVGANLLQSAFTRWCPAIWFFRKIGLKE